MNDQRCPCGNRLRLPEQNVHHECSWSTFEGRWVADHTMLGVAILFCWILNIASVALSILVLAR